MNIDLRDLGKGSFDVGIGVTTSDIDALVAVLQMLKDRRDHFHISATPLERVASKTSKFIGSRTTHRRTWFLNSLHRSSPPDYLSCHRVRTPGKTKRPVEFDGPSVRNLTKQNQYTFGL